MSAIYSVEVLEVRSGDDLLLLVDLDMDDLHKKVRCRLRGVDTPDAYKASPETDAGKIRTEVRKLTREKCSIVVHNKNRNGWIVDLFFIYDGIEQCLNSLLIARGYVYASAEKAAA